METKKAVSLTFELAEIHHAVEAAQIIVDQLRTKGMPSKEAARRAPGAVSAILSLVGVRLRDLGRVVVGRIDPALFLAPHNVDEATPRPNEDPDVRFVEWGPPKVGAKKRKPGKTK